MRVGMSVMWLEEELGRDLEERTLEREDLLLLQEGPVRVLAETAPECED